MILKKRWHKRVIMTLACNKCLPVRNTEPCLYTCVYRQCTAASVCPLLSILQSAQLIANIQTQCPLKTKIAGNLSFYKNTDAYPEHARFLQQHTWCFVMRSDEVPIEIRGCVTDGCFTLPVIRHVYTQADEFQNRNLFLSFERKIQSFEV